MQLSPGVIVVRRSRSRSLVCTLIAVLAAAPASLGAQLPAATPVDSSTQVARQSGQFELRPGAQLRLTLKDPSVRVGNDVRPLSTGSRAFGTFVGLEGSELDLRMQNGDTIDFPSTAIERVEERLSVPG